MQGTDANNSGFGKLRSTATLKAFPGIISTFELLSYLANLVGKINVKLFLRPLIPGKWWTFKALRMVKITKASLLEGPFRGGVSWSCSLR